MGTGGEPGRVRRALALADVEPGPAGRPTGHDRVVDAVLVLVSLAGGVLVWGSLAEALEPMSDRTALLVLVDAAAGVLACLAVPFRRRRPVLLAVLTSVLACWSSAAAVAGLVFLWTAVARSRLTTTLALLPVYLVPAFVFPAVRPQADLTYWPDVVFGVVVTLLAVSAALYVRVRRQLVAVVRDRDRAERERQADLARREERDRIAREMHDVLAHRLSLVSLQAGALEYRPDAPPGELARAAGVVRATAHGALEDLRTVIGLLRSVEDDDAAPDRPQPGLADVASLVDEARGAGQRVRVDDAVAGADVPATTGRTAYRVVQEGLTNARKHAPHEVVDVRLRGAPGHDLVVELVNPLPAGGTGASSPGAGTGLVGLGERAQRCGGSLEHGCTPEGAFRLVARLPWPA